VTWYKPPEPEWLRQLKEELMRASRRFAAYLGRPENCYAAVGMVEAPDPESLGFAVGNPREFLMLSADPTALMPRKALGGGGARGAE